VRGILSEFKIADSILSIIPFVSFCKQSFCEKLSKVVHGACGASSHSSQKRLQGLNCVSKRGNLRQTDGQIPSFVWNV
jgi:hypothetical protein